MFDQLEFDIRCEWGLQGVAHLAPISDAVIIIDALSFTSTVSLAVKRGAIIYPYPQRDDGLEAYAKSLGAIAGGHRSQGGYSLSPASVVNIQPGTRLVLPSPNGGTLSLRTGAVPTLAGSFRNARAAAAAAPQYGRKIAVIPAGEKWKEDQSLRPALEDGLAAGAIINYLGGRRSPEAEILSRSFLASQHELLSVLMDCASSQELRAMGYAEDVRLCAELNADDCAPVLKEGAFRALI